MTCSFDLKEYVLGESSPGEVRRIEAHLADCPACREELSRLQLTQASLLALRDEEMPRRIAFISDKVFEPRWYQRLWNSAPQLGFLAAALLAAAILVHAFARPVSAPSQTVAVDARVIQERVDREVSARLNSAVQTAVTKAVADSEARQRRETVQLLEAADRRNEMDRRATLLAVAEQTRILEKQVNNMYVSANNLKVGE